MSKQKYIIPSTDPKCFYRNGVWYRQIDKRLARKCFDTGKQILLLSSNLCFDNVRQPPMDYVKNGYPFNGYSFDKICFIYEIFNCDAERGRYIHFFIKLDDYTNL